MFPISSHARLLGVMDRLRPRSSDSLHRSRMEYQLPHSRFSLKFVKTNILNWKTFCVVDRYKAAAAFLEKHVLLFTVFFSLHSVRTLATIVAFCNTKQTNVERKSSEQI